MKPGWTGRSQPKLQHTVGKMSPLRMSTRRTGRFVPVCMWDEMWQYDNDARTCGDVGLRHFSKVNGVLVVL